MTRSRREDTDVVVGGAAAATALTLVAPDRSSQEPVPLRRQTVRQTQTQTREADSTGAIAGHVVRLPYTVGGEPPSARAEDGLRAHEPGLAQQAAARLLKRVAVPPSRIQQVIYADSEDWDAPFGSPAGRTARALGLGHARCVEITGFSNAALTAMWLAGESDALRPGEYALVLTGSRLGGRVDPGTPSHSAGAGAAVLLTHHARTFRLLHSAMGPDVSGQQDPTGRDRFPELLATTLGAVGREARDVSRILIDHEDRDARQRVRTELGIGEEHCVGHHDRLGHRGGADTLMALQRLAAARTLRKGDLLLLASGAAGAAWSITAVEYLC